MTLHSSLRCLRFFCWHWRCWRMKPTFWVWKLIGIRSESNLPQIQLLCPQQFQYQAIQWTSSSLLSTSARKFTPLAVQNQKFDAGSVWQNLILIKLTEEYGALAFSRLKFSYIVFTFNRSFCIILKHGHCHEPWKTGSLPLTTSVSDVFFGFGTQTMLQNADVRLQAGFPPHLLWLIQTRRLRFSEHVSK